MPGNKDPQPTPDRLTKQLIISRAAILERQDVSGTLIGWMQMLAPAALYSCIQRVS